MKIKKSKVKIFCIVLAGMIVVAALFFYMALFKGFYASSDKPIGDYSGPADFDFLGRKEIYHVVANKYGEPILKILRVHLTKQRPIMAMQYNLFMILLGMNMI